MAGVSYALADFVTGGPILDLPVMEGASWASQLNRPDEVSCTVDMRDRDALALDLRSSTAPNKTVLLARNDDDVILAWGLISDDGRTWNEDAKTLSLSCQGVTSSYFGSFPIMPPAARTADLTVLDSEGFPIVNPALNTTLAGWSHGTIGKKLVEQALAWPGAPTAFVLPADEIGIREQTYLFSSFKPVGDALDDLSKQEHGPDFAFDAVRAPNGLSLQYVMRHGSEAAPRLGVDVGSWSLGENSPITGLDITDAVAAGATYGWMSSGRQDGAAIFSRYVDESALADGYPPRAVIDTSRSDVSVQATLDSYNAANMADARRAVRDLSFSVRGDATPALGAYRPGDRVTLTVPDGHPWHTGDIPIRIMSISGDETGKTVKIGCVILDA